MNGELKKIKDHFGENFAKLCRELFPTLLEKEGLLSNLIMEHFADNHSLYEDIIKSNLVEKFKNYVYSFIDVEKDNKDINKTPQELLDEAGYILYECKTEEEIQSFKKYYKKGEELCTFRGQRLNSCYVFFAVKKDVEEIKREDFSNPQRQDRYGTSVMSIQFYRGENNTVSIKNRYNHTVNNPDATYSNNLDNIINGLTSSFEREYGLKIGQSGQSQFELPNYIKAKDGKYYKFNYEINNIYYCPNNIIIDNGEPKIFDKSRYIIIDYFVLDLKEKRIIVSENIKDAFVDGLSDIAKIDIRKNNENKDIVVTPKNGKDIIITIDKTNKIIEYENENLTTVGDSFLKKNRYLMQLNAPNLTTVGDKFLLDNESLQLLDAPNLTTVGDSFLEKDFSLQQLNVPNLTTVGDSFLENNFSLQQLDAPNLTTVGDGFLYLNNSLQQLDAPNLTTVGDFFLENDFSLQQLNIPNLTTVGNWFLLYNSSLQRLDVPNLTTVGNGFLENNSTLDYLGRRR